MAYGEVRAAGPAPLRAIRAAVGGAWIHSASLTELGLGPFESSDHSEEFNEAGDHVLIVADGRGAAAASRRCIEALHEAFRDSTEPLDARLRRGFETAAGEMQSDVALRETGVSLVAVAVSWDLSAYMARAGDCRAYRLRDEVLTDVGAEISPSDPLGVGPGGEVDVQPIEIRAGDRLLLCSEGLRPLPEAEIVRTLELPGPRSMTSQLVRRLKRCDEAANVTVCVAVISEPFPAAAEAGSDAETSAEESPAVPAAAEPGAARRRLPLVAVGLAAAVVLAAGLGVRFLLGDAGLMERGAVELPPVSAPPVAEAEAVTEAEVVAEDEVIAEVEAIAEAEAVAEPEAATEAEVVAEPEAVAEAPAVAVAEAAIEAEAVTEVEAVPEAEAIAEVEAAAPEPPAVEAPQPSPPSEPTAPMLEAQPEPVPSPAPEPEAPPAPVAEAQLAPEPEAPPAPKPGDGLPIVAPPVAGAAEQSTVASEPAVAEEPVVETQPPSPVAAPPATETPTPSAESVPSVAEPAETVTLRAVEARKAPTVRVEPAREAPTLPVEEEQKGPAIRVEEAPEARTVRVEEDQQAPAVRVEEVPEAPTVQVEEVWQIPAPSAAADPEPAPVASAALAASEPAPVSSEEVAEPEPAPSDSAVGAPPEAAPAVAPEPEEGPLETVEGRLVASLPPEAERPAPVEPRVQEFLDDWARSIQEMDYGLYKQLGFAESRRNFKRRLQGHEDSAVRFEQIQVQGAPGGDLRLSVLLIYSYTERGSRKQREKLRKIVLHPAEGGLRYIEAWN
jgi:serine/threonine protein phosphatase PrpC